MFRPRQRRGGFAIFLLLAEVMRFGVDRIPPVTLISLGLNVAVFLRLILPLDVHSVCISVESVYYYRDWPRIFLATIFHGSDWHLYYNMVSLLWKGSQLEKKYGSPYFAYMLGVFTVLTHGLLVGLNLLMYQQTNDPFYIRSCAIGASGVLFALKVVLNSISPAGTQYVMGIIPVPSKWICWAELVLIQLLVPNASFTGHLAGILVGLAYVKGPLKSVMNILGSFLLPSEGRPHRSRPFGPSYTYHSSHTGFRDGGDENEINGQQQAQYERYTGGMTEDEQVQWALNNSAQSQASPAPSAPLPEDHFHENSPGDAPYPTYPRMPQPSDHQPEGSSSDAPYPSHQGMPQPSDHQPEGPSDIPYPSNPGMPQPSDHQPNRLYPNLPPDLDDLRRRRMARFN